ncbi:EscR/YscR/HrcR family type III secretion system export apparatus protein [Yersinia mollaretii]|nr:EscR/YscR/HrcR family type III secretion system export apparatus protein [Yersinia mollaretii]
MMPTIPSDIPLLAIIALSTLLPFIIAAGTCYLKISVVLIMVRNAMGVQQVPSSLALNGIALLLSLFVMMPVIQDVHQYMRTEKVDFSNVESMDNFVEGGLGSYKAYLKKYSDPELLKFFESVQQGRTDELAAEAEEEREPTLFSLLPAYALSEIKSAFEIGFYIYLPFVVIDLIISSILLALGMMMMSPVTISVPVKLILFVAIDGWSLISKGLIMQYMELAQH